MYEKELAKLHLELVKMQYWIRKEGKRVVLIFEGRDAAGKGGTITEVRVSPGDSVGSGDIVAVIE